MKKQLLRYKGVYGEQESSFSESVLDHEPLAKRSKIFNFEISEHLHTDLIQIFLITAGGGVLLSEGKKIGLHPPCVLIIPSDALHGFALQSNIQGDVFTLSNTFFESSLQDNQKLLLTLNQLQQLSFNEKTDAYEAILQLRNNLIEELANHRVEKQQVVQLLLQLFLFQLYRVAQQLPSKIILTENKTLLYFNAFQKLIKQHIHQSKSIQQYAKALNISPVHLNRICQGLVQKTALQIVHENLLNEAKKYLLGTSNSIAEISYFLDFNDPSHFSKFFKKMMGVSPRHFRKEKMPKQIRKTMRTM